MKRSIVALTLLTSCSFANLALSPSLPLFSEEGLLIAKESLATAKTGYYIDYIYTMSLKSSHHITHAKQSYLTQYGAAGLCLADLVDLWGFVGVQNNTLHYTREKERFKFKQSSHFSFALYASGILNQWGKWQLGASGFYASSPSNSGSLYKNGSFFQKADYQCYMWGASLGMSYDFPKCAPYARLDYQFSKANLSILKDQFLHTMNPLGLSFGFISDLSSGFFIDFEIRLIQSYATRLMAGLRF